MLGTKIKNRWRRFRPTTRGRIDDITAYEPDSIYAKARVVALETYRRVRPRVGRRHNIYRQTTEAVRLLRQREVVDTVHLLALLILQAPGAARAQNELDKRHGGYRNREARVFELIDFNDVFVNTVLALSPVERIDFVERAKAELDYFASLLHVQGFTVEQFEAITHGLSREIAVFLAARRIGYVAHMSSRVQDAMGVDMAITDPDTKKSINIDVKTHSAYHFRLLELTNQNRMDEEKRLQCELAGYCLSMNGRGEQRVETILFRVATDRLGEIRNFEFTDTGPVATLLASAMHDHGKRR